MNSKRKLSLVAAALLGLSLCGAAQPAPAREEGDSDFVEPQQTTHKLSAISYVSWWSHDATSTGGYRPSILIKLENYSSKDLTGHLIRFQARFTDLTNGIVTVGRRDVRQSLAPHQQIYVLLKGPQAFDLPIEDYRWPIIECKVMCRVGDVGDEGTQTLIVSKLESITMNDDEAMQRMSRMADFHRAASTPGGKNGNHPAPPKPAKPEAPMVAHAEKLQTKHHPEDGKKKPAPPATAIAYVSSKTMPGLGNDFYQFEKAFGLPVETNTSDQGWTWAAYKHSQPSLTLLAGSRGRSGKVDVIILETPERDLHKDSELIEVTRALAGSLKSQKLSAPARSVRYLPSGRMQMLTCTAPGYQSAYFSAASRTQDGNLGFLMLSRIPGNVVDLITEHGKRAGLIQPLAQTLGGN